MTDILHMRRATAAALGLTLIGTALSAEVQDRAVAMRARYGRKAPAIYVLCEDGSFWEWSIVPERLAA